jgi:hypothetical protein
VRVLESTPRLRSIVTRRSILPTAADAGGDGWRAAWGLLFERYAPAMRRYVEGILPKGTGGAEEAADVDQDYVAQAMAKGWLAKDVGTIRCFRAYLQVQLRRFVYDHLDRKHAQKRGPRRLAPAEALDGVAARAADPAAEALDRSWVETALARAMERLREGNAIYHDVVADLLATSGEGSADLGERIGRSPEQVVHLRHRARRRLAALFHEELRETVRDEEAFESLCRSLEPYLP